MDQAQRQARLNVFAPYTEDADVAEPVDVLSFIELAPGESLETSMSKLLAGKDSPNFLRGVVENTTAPAMCRLLASLLLGDVGATAHVSDEVKNLVWFAAAEKFPAFDIDRAWDAMTLEHRLTWLQTNFKFKKPLLTWRDVRPGFELPIGLNRGSFSVAADGLSGAEIAARSRDVPHFHREGMLTDAFSSAETAEDAVALASALNEYLNRSRSYFSLHASNDASSRSSLSPAALAVVEAQDSAALPTWKYFIAKFFSPSDSSTEAAVLLAADRATSWALRRNAASFAFPPRTPIVSNDTRWLNSDHRTEGATPATTRCTHSSTFHKKGEWSYDCCACSGIPRGCDECDPDRLHVSEGFVATFPLFVSSEDTSVLHSMLYAVADWAATTRESPAATLNWVHDALGDRGWLLTGLLACVMHDGRRWRYRGVKPSWFDADVWEIATDPKKVDAVATATQKGHDHAEYRISHALGSRMWGTGELEAHPPTARMLDSRVAEDLVDALSTECARGSGSPALAERLTRWAQVLPAKKAADVCWRLRGREELLDAVCSRPFDAAGTPAARRALAQSMSDGTAPEDMTLLEWATILGAKL